MPDCGDLIELEVGPPVHGGACLARLDGLIVFVRHTLPGERVRARVTESRPGQYLRADAVEVLAASPDRVEPPCPYAGPGRCGGCDWQHVSADRQRGLKADVVRDQFRRLAGFDLDPGFVAAEPLPGGLLGWRTRVTYAADGAGRLGLHAHRSRDLVLVERCPLGVTGVGDSSVLSDRWPGLSGVEVVRGDDGQVAVISHRPGPGRQARGRRPPDRVEVVSGPSRLTHRVGAVRLEVTATGFWQAHAAAADVFADAILAAAQLRPGETVLELYCGAGALTVALADAVGPAGHVLALESDSAAATDAVGNLTERPWTEVRRHRIDGRAVADAGLDPDVIVLDPPRSGAGPEVMADILGSRARAVVYLACDPAALARDTRTALDAGWRMASLRAFDAFPMTAHVECVALFLPSEPRVSRYEPAAHR